MYRNSLRPSVLFGLVLLILAAVGIVLWISLLGATLLDWSSFLLLGASLGFLVAAILFFRRVPWIRVPASVALHLLGLGVIVATFGAMAGEESFSTRIAMSSLASSIVAILAVGVLCLHNEAMRLDFGSSPAVGPGRRSKRRGILLAAVCVLPFLSVVVWRVAPCIQAKPVIAVDYLGQANRAMRPAGYDPNQNAFLVYEELGKGWVTPDLAWEKWRVWPTELSASEADVLKDWGPVNHHLLPLLKKAAECPYWWYEQKSPEGTLTDVNTPDLDKQRKMAWGVVLLAKHKATERRLREALDMLTDLHMMGVHYTTGPTLVDQMVGLAFCEMAYTGALTILDRCQADAASLQAALKAFRPRLSLVEVPRFCEAERLYGYDMIQRSFTDDGNGGGVLTARSSHTRWKASVAPARPLSYLDTLWICTGHPHRGETTRLYNAYFVTTRAAAAQTPWQLHEQDTSCESIIDQLLRGNYFLRDKFGGTGECVHRSWQAKTVGQAFVGILAILTYNAQKGSLPSSLEELVRTRYLDGVPIDPYSGKPFVYRLTGSDFTFYSMGEDFVDDGGRPATWQESQIAGDRVFWPVQAEVATPSGK